jgi:ATP-binding cassette subfamily F protein uup
VRRSGRLVIEAEKVSFTYEGRPILKDFSAVLQRGDKVGIIGPNGSGKTTLLRLLLGELQPQKGSIELGTNLEIAYFDQLRSQLDENQTVLDNVGQGRDTILINGKTRNLIGYLEDFLFSRERVHAPISALSGGERNRLLLARLFARPANLLVMDEPTNDLDIETLELLEDMLLEYSGTLLLVSHDRAFINNLVTSTIVLDGKGGAREFVGGYDDSLRQSQNEQKGIAHTEAVKKPASLQDKAVETKSEGERKLTYKEKRALEAEQQELTGLPGRIEALEAEQQRLSVVMADPGFYQGDAAEIAATAERIRQLEEELAQAYARWEELESKFNQE